MSDEDDGTLLDERAEQLARRSGNRQVRRPALRAVIVRAGEETYGVPIQSLRQVVDASPICPLPGLPPHLLGVATARGELVSVVDLAELHGAGRTGTIERFAVIVDEGRSLALAVEDVLGFRDIQADELVEPLRDHAQQAEFSRWFTTDHVRLLDIPILMRSARLVVRGAGSPGEDGHG